MFDKFTQLVLDRQSCRDFNDKELDKETLKKLFSLATDLWQIMP